MTGLRTAEKGSGRCMFTSKKSDSKLNLRLQQGFGPVKLCAISGINLLIQHQNNCWRQSTTVWRLPLRSKRSSPNTENCTNTRSHLVNLFSNRFPAKVVVSP